MTTDEAIRRAIKAGAPGLTDLIVDAIVRSAMMKIHHHAGVELSEENDRLMTKLKMIHEMAQDHSVPYWQTIENVAATAGSVFERHPHTEDAGQS